jgi:hypothetical protein
VLRIEVRIQVGNDRLAASDDPLFFGVRGPGGREFRLEFSRGRAFRRGSEDHFVLGAPDDPQTNVEHPDLNDPTRPALDGTEIQSVYVRKGFEPVPNVRGMGEMDDRLELAHIEVQVVLRDESEPRRFARGGPVWLGLVSGLLFEIPLVPPEA